MADEQQPSVRIHLGHRVARLRGVEAAGEGRILAQALALIWLPLPRGELGGLLGTLLGTEQHHVEGHAKPGERYAGDPRLALAARRQSSLCVGARSVRLCLGVPQYPELTSHSPARHDTAWRKISTRLLEARARGCSVSPSRLFASTQPPPLPRATRVS